jgi:uncharacterized protein YxjI
MVIEIIREAISVGKKYQIRVDGEAKYRVSGMFVAFLGGKLNVANTVGNTLAQIERKIYLIRPDYRIVLPSRETFRFRAQSLFRGIYSCVGIDSRYFLYAHTGLIASIFKSDQQIAALMKGGVAALRGDYYSILADDDTDELLITCIGIVFDNYNWAINVRSNGIPTINFGNIIFRKDHPFDETWQPKIKGK